MLATSSLGICVTRPRASLLAERDTYGQHVRHSGQCSVARSGRLANDNAACALASGDGDPYPGHLASRP
jgi:hypothetical protein